ncbi:rhomboid family intramembrane serine protease [bacterium]|nr:rhomboid family intramembrane serine protease [bacterium]
MKRRYSPSAAAPGPRALYSSNAGEPSHAYRPALEEAPGRGSGRSSQRGSPLSWFITALCLVSYLVLNVMHPQELLYYTFSPGNGLMWPGLLSHMFLHNGPAHLFFNMFLLFSIGRLVEEGYGSLRFAAVYIVSGLVAALAQASFSPDVFLLGASGALAGILAVFVRHLPGAELLVFGIIPMPAWVLAILWMGYNLYGASAGEGNIAFVAHIAGFLCGLMLSFTLVPPRWAMRRTISRGQG